MDRSTARDRSTTRRLCLLLVAGLLALTAFAAVGGCGGDDEARQRAAAAAARRRAAAEEAAHARAMEVGRRLFAKNCQACHTLAGKRYTGPIIEFEAPNLDEVRLKPEYVRYRLDVGGPAMGSFGREWPRSDVEALIEYVAETAGGNVTDDGQQSADVLAQGRALFAEHCQLCHAIEGRRRTGRLGEISYPGMNFTMLKPSVEYVMEKLREGVLPEGDMMPSFRGTLSEPEMQAVAAYVNAVSKEGPEVAEE